MKLFDPFDWYWIVGADTEQVYSSLTSNYVPVADAGYAAWADDGTAPTNIDTEFNLGVALAAYYPRLYPIPAGVLEGYSDAVAVRVAADPTFAIIFDHENRIRAQEGLPPLGIGQAKAAFRAQIQSTPPPTPEMLADNGGVAHDGDK